MKNVLILCLIILSTVTICEAQKKSYNLQQLLKEKKLITFQKNKLILLIVVFFFLC